MPAKHALCSHSVQDLFHQIHTSHGHMQICTKNSIASRSCHFSTAANLVARCHLYHTLLGGNLPCICWAPMSALGLVLLRCEDMAWLPSGEWRSDPRLEALGQRTVLPAQSKPTSPSGEPETEGIEFKAWRIEHGVAEGDTEMPSGQTMLIMHPHTQPSAERLGTTRELNTVNQAPAMQWPCMLCLCLPQSTACYVCPNSTIVTSFSVSALQIQQQHTWSRKGTRALVQLTFFYKSI